MARILMASIPAYGLATPSFPLATALVDAGHTVDYLLTEPFRKQVERTGASLLPYGQPLGHAVTHPKDLIGHGRDLFRGLNTSIRRIAHRYDAVLSGVNPQIPALERELDCPVVFLSPVFFQNDRTLAHFAEIATGLPAPARRLMHNVRARHLLSGVVGRVIFGQPLDDIVRLLGLPSATLNISPSSRYYQPFDEDFTERALFIGPTPTQSVPDPSFPLDRLREHDGPVVYATLGTVFNRHLPYFQVIAEAFADTEYLLVITTGNPATVEAVDPGADNVIVRSFVPQADVLREADVCFTHGGFGSATDTVCLGVPAVFTPMGADQYLNAYRIHELGAGHILTRDDVTVASVRQAAVDAMSGDRTSGLAALRESFETAGGPQAAVRAIEGLL